ncbi:MAG: asparagine synthase-related protein [Nannocystaceae bacterium]
MAAICGYVGPGDDALLLRQLELMRHRGAHAHALASTPSAGLGVSVPRGRSAVVGRSRDGRVRCVVDGALFDHATLADELGLPRDCAVSELLAELLAKDGTAALARLDGAYALAAAWDDRVLIARDPLGEKPIYYALLPDGRFGFASEIKAFLGDPSFRVRPHEPSLVALLVFSFIPGERSMFDDVFELPPGSHLELRPGQRGTITQHFQLREQVADRELSYFTTEIERLCNEAVDRRIPADGRVCATLSGGVDSSSVVAMLAKRGLKPVCFSAAFGDGEPNELGYARLVAEHCGVEHRVLDVEPEGFLDLLPRVMWNLDDPLCDCITVPNYLLAQAAAAEAPVVFNGEGGDPLFGGPKNKFLILGEWYRAYGGYDRARAYLASYHKFYDHAHELLTPEFVARTGGTEALCDYVRPMLDDPSTGSFLNRLMHINIRLKGGQNIRVKVDKMVCANGVEPASPLFDRRLAEFSFTIPPLYKRRGDIEKFAFKKAIEHLLPHPVVYRKKAGMGVPLNHWFRREPLRGYTRDVLLSPRARSRGYFDMQFVERLTTGKPPATMVGRDRTGELLWMLLAIELWHRVFVDGEGCP